MTTPRLRRLLAAAALAPLAACSTPPTLLSLGGRACDPAPKLSRDHPVEFGSTSGATATLDATTPCLDTPAGPASYAVFALPNTTTPYRITIRSTRRGGAILWPNATVYGSNDQPRTRIDSIRPASSALVGSTTGQPGDHYLVITSTPATIGQPEAIPTAALTPPIRLAATAVFVPIIIPNGPIGPTTDKYQLTLAHSGQLTVTALPFMTIP